MPSPIITSFVLGEYQTNCFVVHTPGSAACWIVDCGLEPDQMLDWIGRKELKPQAILLTHSHLDHIAGVDQARRTFGNVPVSIHHAEAAFCTDPLLNLSALIGLPTTCAAPERNFSDGDTLDLNGTTWRVLHTPGHSPGGACFIHDPSKQAIVGDTLFAGSIGRSDFPTSNPDDLRNSLHNILMKLPDDTTIYPGHGPKTTIGAERKTNPFILGAW